MPLLLDRTSDLPQRVLAAGEVLLAEGERSDVIYVVADGAFEVSRQGSMVAKITEPGSVLGEISVLLDLDHGATVTATSDATVHVVEDPLAFMSGDSESLLEISRTLAERLNRLVGYIADVKAQYGDSGDHLAMLDEVLSELTYGRPRPVEAGSERDPDPTY